MCVEIMNSDVFLAIYIAPYIPTYGLLKPRRHMSKTTQKVRFMYAQLAGNGATRASASAGKPRVTVEGATHPDKGAARVYGRDLRAW